MSKQIDLEKVTEKAWDIANDPNFDQFEACTALKDAALAIKQAQETIAALEKDAARYQWLIKQSWFQQAFDRFEPDDGGMQKRFESECARIIDTAMEASNAKAD